jgi:hypothetical protein
MNLEEGATFFVTTKFQLSAWQQQRKRSNTRGNRPLLSRGAVACGRIQGVHGLGISKLCIHQFACPPMTAHRISVVQATNVSRLVLYVKRTDESTLRSMRITWLLSAL